MGLLKDVVGPMTYARAWAGLDAERERRAAGAGAMPIRLGRDRASAFSEWLTARGRAHAASSDAGDQARGQQFARVAIAVESALKSSR
jgi:hypothetical protein